MITLSINRHAHVVDAEPDAPLMWVLRESLGLTSVKFGCGVGVCGACTVHIDGAAVRSCVVKVADVQQASIVTLEGLPAEHGNDVELHPVQAAWIENAVPQCGYCQPGMIMTAAALLRHTPHPSDAQIEAAMTNLCRCGTYPRIRRAIRSLAGG